ncbi:unnamed protein product [Calypogeia fissa]
MSATPPLMQFAIIAVCLALTLAELPFLACAASRGGTFVSYGPNQRFRYGGHNAPRHDFVATTTQPMNPRRSLGRSLAPNLGRRGKMLFGTLSCASQDLSLTQGSVVSTSGIPTFDVQIVNLCGVCAMAEIHVACGNWASATPVDPFVFTRLGYNDCLVNNGAPLSSQGSVSFQYSNSAMYPMSITSASTECHR